ncbi:efflux RND transporter periplasmic adaptor subunit [Rivibacter subsaxonicus]|uniref:Membrane fusion protein (Multidrug efflux system) n=1 Tax=Rivibacter subsaxonicus TaxID=457575 RepID=A0A4Q7VND7_9BURK|nr:efflux RND transporter periplasmic adaptor subunit [Rivibacter subsaxonicus]RZT97819.1 membrane fusion protein (multidrug efflux system) [Rivibacter subsaxonicus]
MNQNRKLHLLVAVVGLIALSALAWWWQHRPAATPAAAPAGGPTAVEVARAERGTMADEATAVGTLRSRQGVVLRPEVGGRVVRLGFADGARVRRGQVLMQLDDSLQRAQLEQAKAQAAISRTTLKRNEELVAQNFVTRSVVDQAQANLDVAEAQVALAQAQLARMRIEAPFDGTAGIRKVNVGDVVKESADIVTLEDISALYVDFRLPERYIARLAPGQPVTVTVDALPGSRLEAQVTALESLVDNDGRSLAVRALLPKPQNQLKPGMFARVRLVLEQRNAVLVPEEAIVPQGSKQYVVKVVKGDKGASTQRVEVATGLRREGAVEVTQGLQAGDTVVTAGQSRLMRADGMPVKVVEVGAAPPRAASAPASGPGTKLARGVSAG